MEQDNKMKQLIFFVVFLCSLIRADDSSFFGYSKVKFFDTPEEQKESVQKETQIQQSLFAEPVVGPDGKIRIYVPPRPVLEFLNNPNEENAKEYLKWNKQRIEKIAKAQAVLQKVVKEEQLKKTSVAKKGIEKERRVWQTKKTSVAKKKELAVALSQGCKYCNAQIFVLEAFKKRHPSLNIKIVWFGDKNKIPHTTLPVLLGKKEDRKKIRKFPTFFFTLPSGKVVAGEGFIDGRSLELFCKKIGFL